MKGIWLHVWQFDCGKNKTIIKIVKKITRQCGGARQMAALRHRAAIGKACKRRRVMTRSKHRLNVADVCFIG